MRLLVVNGFAGGEPAPLVDRVESFLIAQGHDVSRVDLAAEGFDETMSADERAVYMTDEPLLSEPQKAGAAAVAATEGFVICYPVVHGTAPPRVKSWQERVFVLGVAFRFDDKGVITGALDHIRRALVVGVDPQLERRWRHRNAFGPCLARLFRLSSNRACRSRYLSVPSADPTPVAKAVRRWQ